jgi:N-acyl-D-aspartate/D-glutamate deacylase
VPILARNWPDLIPLASPPESEPAPEMVFDLPAGGRRLVQRVNGYEATIVAGEVTFEDGEPTGALPGALVRGCGR